jgi:putative peptidoglycan lipid II flippase
VFDRAVVLSLAKFAAGVILAAALWLTSRWVATALAGMTSLRMNPLSEF